MSLISRKEEHWFTVADALIIIVTAALIISAVVLFVLPASEDTEQSSVSLFIQVSLDEPPDGINRGDKVFRGETEIGEVTTSDGSSYMLVIKAEAEKRADGYYVNDEAVRINGGFKVETRVRAVTGVVVEIEAEG